MGFFIWLTPAEYGALQRGAYRVIALHLHPLHKHNIKNRSLHSLIDQNAYIGLYVSLREIRAAYNDDYVYFIVRTMVGYEVNGALIPTFLKEQHRRHGSSCPYVFVEVRRERELQEFDDPSKYRHIASGFIGNVTA
jgi:hypothetical protein